MFRLGQNHTVRLKKINFKSARMKISTKTRTKLMKLTEEAMNIAMYIALQLCNLPTNLLILMRKYQLENQLNNFMCLGMILHVVSNTLERMMIKFDQMTKISQKVLSIAVSFAEFI